MVPTPTQPAEVTSTGDLVFEELYRESRDDVFAYVAGLLRDRSAAEEVTAQAFERAYRKRGQFRRARGSGRAWLFGIARNAALDELRRRSKLAPMPEAEQGSADPDPGEVAVRLCALRDAIATLNARERELVALKFFAGLSNAEIAQVIGVSETNAGSKLHRTIEKLRRHANEAA
ncbi:MAG: sigma-70 family RNA polymerase sigma factor [Solirubrobacterales bacterium]|nr:sigma-70 family RNA polymerase sigma factor [Solirubrobacterales bacterium]